MPYETIVLEKEEGFAILTLNQPRRQNALSSTMVREASQAIRDVAADERMRALVVTGAGDAFCSGAEVGDLAEAEGLTSRSSGASEEKPAPEGIALLIHEMEKPAICAINGAASGSGISIALACDLRIASEAACFDMDYVLRGLLPDSGCSFFLPKLAGTAYACELVFTGDSVLATRAAELGLVNRVVPHAELLTVVKGMAGKLANRPPIAMKYAKLAIHRGFTEPNVAPHLLYEHALNVICMGTSDFKEAVNSFLEKREPVFRGM